ncbi:MAG: ribbon-helix-helix protein, CopG family [Nakamurella sp.]
MARKRTTVFADEEDLAILKAAAARLGVPEAELLRDAIHLAAMSNRVWDEPVFERCFLPVDQSGQSPYMILESVWDGKAAAYERTKRQSR